MKKEMNKTYKICLSGVFAALIAVCSFALKLPIASGQGYIHIGDAFVYLSACFLGPYGILASAIGASLADLLSGCAIWAIPSAIIKSCNCLPFIIAFKLYKKPFRLFNKYTFISVFLSGAITVGGYFAFEIFLYSKEAAALDLIWNVIQASASAVLFICFSAVLDKLKTNKL